MWERKGRNGSRPHCTLKWFLMLQRSSLTELLPALLERPLRLVMKAVNCKYSNNSCILIKDFVFLCR